MVSWGLLKDHLDWFDVVEARGCAEPTLLRTVQRDRNVGLPPRQRECPRQGNKLNEQIGMSRGKRAKLAGKKVVPQSIGSADANSA